VVDAEFILQFPILLFDRPAPAHQRHHLLQRGGRVEVEQIEFPLVGGERPLTKQPAIPAALSRADAAPRRAQVVWCPRPVTAAGGAGKAAAMSAAGARARAGSTSSNPANRPSAAGRSGPRRNRAFRQSVGHDAVRCKSAFHAAVCQGDPPLFAKPDRLRNPAAAAAQNRAVLRYIQPEREATRLLGDNTVMPPGNSRFAERAAYCRFTRECALFGSSCRRGRHAAADGRARSCLHAPASGESVMKCTSELPAHPGARSLQTSAHVGEERVEILTGGVPLGRSTEARGELIDKLSKSSQQRPGRRVRHAPQRTQLSGLVQVRSFGSRRTAP
jgi:hypothetical protein